MEVPVHAGSRCNSGRSETLLRRRRRLSPETLNVFSVPNAELPVMPSNGGKCLCSAGFMQRYSALLEGSEEGDDRSIGSESRRYPARQQKIL
jgi:hypothetical protein